MGHNGLQTYRGSFYKSAQPPTGLTSLLANTRSSHIAPYAPIALTASIPALPRSFAPHLPHNDRSSSPEARPSTPSFRILSTTQIYHISLQARVSLTNAEAATPSPRTTSPGSEHEKLDNRYSAPQRVLTNASVHAPND
ncbi:hypothetical protein P691DRAFT_780237 [Macrolepiota fuliginosa MF-IS2]|uniref:Uncharacterized protein n=1 Tax=Macrolepiota fuliginosa MF-IS2 TaxID=1400762 RepID=A0A9P5WWH9_9AGAR|nr:hypothetical protein P691DRAFT_780237 [Macrolepiota fuliginosa MF-IS2]